MSRAEYDAFVSYASENREDVARPVAELLTALGVRVWFDEMELRIGDSLRRTIDKGLARSQFGVVLLSSHFFEKYHTNRELDGLAQREVEGQKVILPVWVDVSEDEVRSYSPPLADRKAALWKDGLATVARQLLKVIKPEFQEKAAEDIARNELYRVSNGAELFNHFASSMLGSFHNDEPDNAQEVDLLSQFFDGLQDWGDVLSDLGPGRRVEAEYEYTQLIKELEEAGWSVFTRGTKRRMRVHGVDDEWPHCTVAVLRGRPLGVYRRKDGIAVFRTPSPEAEERDG